jgi:4-amino-4-deoxychorismate lyase
MNLVNGAAIDVIGVRDRGLSYGDGVFRTFPLRDGKPVMWDRQYAKLMHDCRRLAIECPGSELLDRDLALLGAATPACVAKIIITRGESMRGYALPHPQAPTRVVTSGAIPKYPEHYAEQGVQTHLCKLRLSHQPAFAGIKHLNRLENVMARTEWSDTAIAEGLMCDVDDNVICGTMTNLFVVKNGGLFTPVLEKCGVSGVMRDVVIELADRHQIPVRITEISIDELLDADEVFVVNSVIGLWPVAGLNSRVWKKGSITVGFQHWIQNVQSH